MAINLSVNLNKVALLRNSRTYDVPSVKEAAVTCLLAGAAGITVHPRPDQRHIRYVDVPVLSSVVQAAGPGREFNVEGYPSVEFLELVTRIKPHQCTLVPDPPEAQTSTFGWDTLTHAPLLRDAIGNLHHFGVRVALFVAADRRTIDGAKEVGADRIELFTTPYVEAFDRRDPRVIEQYVTAAVHATSLGMGVNAGHDLRLDVLPTIRAMPGLLEVSIGHAFVSDCLRFGYESCTKKYIRALEE